MDRLDDRRLVAEGSRRKALGVAGQLKSPTSKEQGSDWTRWLLNASRVIDGGRYTQERDVLRMRMERRDGEMWLASEMKGRRAGETKIAIPEDRRGCPGLGGGGMEEVKKKGDDS